MTVAGALERGRHAYRSRAWGEAYAHLVDAGQGAALGADDLERLATAAYLVGRDEDSADAWGRAHQERLSHGDEVRAIRCAFWAALGLLLRGQHARGGGWLGRAHRLLDEGGHDCVERGYLLVPAGLQRMATGDATAAHATFVQAGEIAGRFDDPDLRALARLGQGHALIRLGEIADGGALFDEVMIAVTAGEVSTVVAGIVYCQVIEDCQELCDLRRAREWTAALTRWCAEQPDLVPYRGQCMVYRAEIMQLRGAWPDALREARLACERLAGQPAVGLAWYRTAELLRVRGELAEAEQAYREAHQAGRESQPGLALLWLASGRIDEARAALDRMVEQVQDRLVRARLLAAHVEILLRGDEVAGAGRAAAELEQIAVESGAAMLRAMAAEATGAVLLAEGSPRGACDELRTAWLLWQELEAPYEAARVRVLLGRACRETGDEGSARLELDAARTTFEQLGAPVELARLDTLTGPAAAGRARTGLTERETEVLGLVAAGRTNREIATELVLSEHTVRRHLQNIFAKIGVSSRAGATAFAFRNELV